MATFGARSRVDDAVDERQFSRGQSVRDSLRKTLWIGYVLPGPAKCFDKLLERSSSGRNQGQGAIRREVLGNQGFSPTIPKHKLRRQERDEYPGSIICQFEDASVVEALKDVICGEQSLGMFVRGIFQPLVEGLAGIARREFQ
jgi:hypothetical protein